MKERVAINFNAPKDIRDKFDAVCRTDDKTRTGALLELMKGYIVSQARVLARQKADSEQVDPNSQNSAGWHNAPPEFFRSDGFNIW